MSDRDVFMDRLFGAAQSHGEETLDMDLGDLEMLLLEAVDQMTPEQFEQFKASQVVQDVLTFEPEAGAEEHIGHAERLESEMEDEDSAYVTLGDDLSDDSNPYADDDQEDD